MARLFTTHLTSFVVYRVRFGPDSHAHLHRHTCLSHARTHTRSNATVVTGFCSSFPLAEFPFPLFSVILLRLLRRYFVKRPRKNYAYAAKKKKKKKKKKKRLTGVRSKPGHRTHLTSLLGSGTAEFLKLKKKRNFK